MRQAGVPSTVQPPGRYPAQDEHLEDASSSAIGRGCRPPGAPRGRGRPAAAPCAHGAGGAASSVRRGSGRPFVDHHEVEAAIWHRQRQVRRCGIERDAVSDRRVADCCSGLLILRECRGTSGEPDASRDLEEQPRIRSDDAKNSHAEPNTSHRDDQWAFRSLRFAKDRHGIRLRAPDYRLRAVPASDWTGPQPVACSLPKSPDSG